MDEITSPIQETVLNSVFWADPSSDLTILGFQVLTPPKKEAGIGEHRGPEEQQLHKEGKKVTKLSLHRKNC